MECQKERLRILPDAIYDGDLSVLGACEWGWEGAKLADVHIQVHVF